MKKYIVSVLILVILLCMTACDSDVPETAHIDPENLKIGTVYIGSQYDTAGYTYAHHNGIVAAMESLDLDIATQLIIQENIPEVREDVLTAIDVLVADGANLIFGISFGYMDYMEEAAAKYPDVIFSHATGYKSNTTNFNNYFGRIYQARYLAGIVAGLKSLEIGIDNIGYVSAYGTEYAETASGINGFSMGVQAVNPDAVIYVKTLGSWGNETKEYAHATELIQTYGCGIISQHCDSAQPLIAAEHNGVFGCGYNSDMTQDAPVSHLTAAIWNWDIYYRTAIQAVLDCQTASKFVKTMGSSAYYGGLSEGIVDISPMSDNCAYGTEKAVAKVKELIVSREWDVFSGIKLQISADGTITMIDDDLLDTDGNLIIRAGSASLSDQVITGTMDYLVEGVYLVD